MSESNVSLDELRVLVVEDEILIAMMLEEMLEDFGCLPVGPCGDLASALASCEQANFDVALVDMNLGGVPATPVLEALDKSGIPYALSTGAEAQGTSDVPRLQKPFNVSDLQKTLHELSRRRG
ncbi:response regulator [Novosphingobium aquimarinum]|uniref:response regulator n=1 Tax=Novosphingobium aquimarinum TaxID=2682494 RepID=UPI0012EC35B4|nr:response regulator [Novosphingobium aquimarinum]